jgi:peptide/nickel transport system permease protein
MPKNKRLQPGYKKKNYGPLWGGILSVLIVLILMSPVLFPDSNDINLSEMLENPNAEHLFGTDEFGRDLLARTMNGIKLSLFYALIIEAVALTIGLTVGMASGFLGGAVDNFLCFVMNIFQVFPSSVAAIALIAILGANDVTLIVILSLMGWAAYARLVRSETLTFKERDFILGARAAGASNFYILIKHILPNVLLPLLPLVTLFIGHEIMSIAGLSFLGFGVQPPNAEIGLMLKDSATYINIAPWLLIFPGVSLAIVVSLINALGDSLRDKLDPQSEIVER